MAAGIGRGTGEIVAAFVLAGKLPDGSLVVMDPAVLQHNVAGREM